jgi:D-methionine transport system permease protein
MSRVYVRWAQPRARRYSGHCSPRLFRGLLAAITVTALALIGYSAMSGVIGGGGLGDLAVRYGYQRFNTPVMIVTVAILVVLVQLVQAAGDRLIARLSHR